MVKNKGNIYERSEPEKEASAIAGRERKISKRSCLRIFTSILSFRLSIKIFKIAVIVILTPIPSGREFTPIYFVKKTTDKKVKIPPMI